LAVLRAGLIALRGRIARRVACAGVPGARDVDRRSGVAIRDTGATRALDRAARVHQTVDVATRQRIHAALGTIIEDQNRRLWHRAAATIGPDDVWAKRPGTGIPARRLDDVIGRVAKRAIASGRLVQWDDLEPGSAA